MKRLRNLPSLILLVATLSIGAWARGIDATPPAITVGLADPSDMGKILPTPSDRVVSADARGMVRVRVKITDAGAGVKAATITAPGASASLLCSPTAYTFIGAGWDTRRAANGAQATFTVTARDGAGNTSSRSVTLTLRK